MIDQEFDRLMDLLVGHLSVHPADAGRILRLVASAMTDYEAAQKRKRDTLAHNALHMILDKQITTRLPIGMTIDAMFHQFPGGPLDGHSMSEKECWDAFLRKWKKDPPGADWLMEVKGREYFDWYQFVIEPFLRKKKPA